MKQKTFLFRLATLLICIFAVGRIVFMLYNGEQGLQSWTDIPMAWLFGLPQDIATTAALLAPVVILLWLIRPQSLRLRLMLLPYYILLSLSVGLIIAGDTVMYEFWKFKLSAVVLSYAASPEGASSSVSTWFMLSRIGYALALILTTLVGASLITPSRISKERKPYFLPSMAILLIAGCALTVCSVGQAYLSKRLFINHAAVNPVYQFASSFQLGKDYADHYNYLSEDELAKEFQGLYPADTEDVTDTLLNTTRPNVLVVLMESFSGKFVQELGGIPNVAPNFSRLVPEGIFWDNYYSNSFRTDRGTVSAFSGYLSYTDVGLMRQSEFHDRLPSLARSLNAQGYESNYLYAGAMTNMGKRQYLADMDFQHLLDKDVFTAEELNTSWGANDSTSAMKAFHLIAEKGEKPWFMVYQTISSHEPWDVPYHRLDDKILNAFAYTDQCVGDLVDSLKTLPAWDNTLVILIPDHGYLYEQSYEDSEFFHSPMLWLGGAVKEARRMQVLMNQSDLAATLLSQLGISHKEYEWSRNVLSRNYTYPFIYSNYPAGFLFKDATGTTMYDVTANKVVSTSADATDQRVRRGQAILQTSYDKLQQPVR